MNKNLVRDIHDAAATSENAAEASVRPSGTTPRELAAMHRDVLRKLALGSDMSVLEIGCGIALVGLPVASRASRYVGLDFAPRAVHTANRRFLEAGLANKATAVDVDVLALGDSELRDLGRFDRVLAYAVLHYARSEQEAVRFLEVTHDLLATGGRALIGNLPLEDLRADWPPSRSQAWGPVARLRAAARWTANTGNAAVPLTRRWKVQYLAQSAIRGHSRDPAFVSPQLPPNYTLPLTTVALERWLRAFGDLSHRWALPAPGVPLAAGRADLILVRR
jgi:SAM-dependent methyltransferase